MKQSQKIVALLALGSMLLGCAKDDEKRSPDPIPAAGAVEVKGVLVDIRPFAVGEKIYPQHNGYTFGTDIENLFDEEVRYAVGLMESAGPLQARCGSDGKIVIAADAPDLSAFGWSATGGGFSAGEVAYYIHTLACKAGAWIDIPQYAEREISTMVIAPVMRVADTSIPGTVIAKVPELRGRTISNASITVLPDGRYIASCTGASDGVSLFASNDKGETWTLIRDDNETLNGIANYYNLFVHNGALYMMGCGRGGANVYISRSDDGGLTWSRPDGTSAPEPSQDDADTAAEADDEAGDGGHKRSGLLLEGSYHSSTVATAVSGGRIWRAMERKSGDSKLPFVMSAPADADLLLAENWTLTNEISVASLTLNGETYTEFIEGNVVATPDGRLYNLLRASNKNTSLTAMLAPIKSITEIAAISAGNLVNMPGGGKKFTVRYDEQSGRYWAITNPASSSSQNGSAGKTHNGIYSGGITYDLVRNRLVLIYSTDLQTWYQYKEIISDKDPFFHGYQYADWQFDGSDIVLVSRTACPEERGLPVRQHDANILTFHRIKNFRTL